MLVKSDVLSRSLLGAVDALVPENAGRRFRGSFPRKRILSPVTDVDVEVSIPLAGAIPNVAADTAVNVQAPFFFLSAECGERKAVVPPWCIADDGTLLKYDQIQAEAWLERLMRDEDLPRTLVDQVQSIAGGEDPFSPHRMTTGKLAAIELLVRPLIGIVWNVEDLRAGFQVVDGASVNLKDLVEHEKRSLCVDYAYANHREKKDGEYDDFCVVQVVYVDGAEGAPRGGSEPRRTALKYLANDAPAVFKDLRWIIPRHLGTLYHAVAESVEWDLAISSRHSYLGSTIATASRREKIQLPDFVREALKRDRGARCDPSGTRAVLEKSIREIARLIPEKMAALPASAVVQEIFPATRE